MLGEKPSIVGALPMAGVVPLPTALPSYDTTKDVLENISLFQVA